MLLYSEEVLLKVTHLELGFVSEAHELNALEIGTLLME
jgi:hypothetical protein